MTMIAVFALTACLGSDFADSVEGSWELETGVHEGDVVPIVTTHPITMTLDSGRIGGTAACNGYGGGYMLSGSDFSIQDGLSVTEMACQPEDVMDSERAFLEALVATNRAELTNEGLVLRGPDTELTFTRLEPVPTSDLLGTVWVLEGLLNGDAVTSPASDAEPSTLELFEDGTFVGSTGCREISGLFEVTGAEVQFTDWGAEGECHPGLQEQDSRVISALEGGFRVEIDGNRMTTWVPGDEGLLYRSQS